MVIKIQDNKADADLVVVEGLATELSSKQQVALCLLASGQSYTAVAEEVGVVVEYTQRLGLIGTITAPIRPTAESAVLDRYRGPLPLFSAPCLVSLYIIQRQVVNQVKS